ncbi:MAG: Aminomethyltransferase [Alphaproteobacteria bacterium MarineAlpha5_Bin9]|nr:MAG: Aminomethyltransferase [Alphaproteobacteria bacterium MarineAlpha5_Bin9]|tara:strand:- start:21439 stop:23799 length:2361 start_codon:yes stop_codon:yes gene_type:complete
MLDIDINKFNLRKSNPYQVGKTSLKNSEERYISKSLGLVGINIQKGDEISIKNIEGMQACEIVSFDINGMDNLGIIGKQKNSDASFIKKILKSSNNNKILISKLQKIKIDLHNFNSYNFFDQKTKAGEIENFTVHENGFIIVSSPGESMSVENQTAASDLEIIIKRINSNNRKLDSFLPDPLAETKNEYLIKDSTAIAYEVNKGDFIQVIDLFGRQCSDFMAFDGPSLQNGKELMIDPTATRAIVGGAYPMPGLFSKYFDKNQDTLIEVIQDTIGRHDTFGTACTLKTYEDQGYFGHVNCSDNYNKELENYGVEKRNAWQAINLFFNTSIDSTNVLFSDIPWSRAGDYVLFQAQKDLVCVSSACPDDIDPANDWNPTDIYVRVYSEKNTFSKAIGYRKSADSDFMLTKQTGFHKRTSMLTNDMMESSGFWIPKKYNNYGAIEEYSACRNNVTIMDLSSLRKFEVLGPDAEELMNTVLTRNIKKLSIGQVIYSALCYENGTMIDDGTLYRLGEHNFRWICGNDYSGEWLRNIAKKLNLNAWIKTSTNELHNISIQGPNSRDLLSKIIWTPPNFANIQDLKWFNFSISRIKDHLGPPLMLSRTGYTGELGYELYCHPKDAVKIWDTVWNLGKEFNLTPMGFEALDMLRIEAGLILGGNEFSDQTDPFEAGIGFTVPLKSKDVNFIGKEALIKRKENPQKKLVGLELDGNEKANHGDCVHIDRGQVGIITSGTMSPILNKNIALCRIDANYSALETQVEIGKLDGHQKRIKAKIVNFPFYDPEKTKVRS